MLSIQQKTSVLLSQAPQRLFRSVGVMVMLSGLGSPRRDPLTRRALRRLSILPEPSPAHADPPLLDRLPLGAEPLAAPPPELPPGLDGPWPQTHPLDPRLSPAVVDFGRADKYDHYRYNVARYLGQLAVLTPVAALRASLGPRLHPLPDETFSALLTETSTGQFVVHTLDPQDRRAFAAHLTSGDEARFAKVDCSGVCTSETYPGTYLSPTVTLLERRSDGTYRTVAIQVGKEVFTPRDGAAWELSKYFVTQGLNLLNTVIAHPRLHFPFDALNAITRTLLPSGHLLSHLLVPHMRFTLGLHFGVLFHRRSILHNSQSEMYAGYPFDNRGTINSFALGLHGIEGNSSYPEFEFESVLIGEHTAYGRYRRDWFDAIYEFTSAITALIPKGDPLVVRWADAIHQVQPKFPSGDRIFSGDTLARITALYIATVSVFHTADHDGWGGVPVEIAPIRLHAPPPDQVRPTELDLASLVTPESYLRQYMMRAMFFQAHVIESLRDVRHRFQKREAQAASRALFGRMDELDDRYRTSPFPDSYHLAASIQY